jgi:probable cell surface protein
MKSKEISILMLGLLTAPMLLQSISTVKADDISVVQTQKDSVQKLSQEGQYFGQTPPRKKFSTNLLDELPKDNPFKYVHGDGSDLRAMAPDAYGRAATVQLYMRHADGNYTIGTGAFVGNRTILTVGHNFLKADLDNTSNDITDIWFVVGSNSAYTFKNNNNRMDLTPTSGTMYHVDKSQLRFFNQANYSSVLSKREDKVLWENDLAAIQIKDPFPILAKKQGLKNDEVIRLSSLDEQLEFNNSPVNTRNVVINGYPGNYIPGMKESGGLKSAIVSGVLYRVASVISHKTPYTVTGGDMASGTLFEFKNTAVGGMSGAAVLNEKGNLVGTYHFSSTGGKGIAGGLLFSKAHHDWIEKLVKENTATGWYELDGSRYYLGDDGNIVKNTSREIDGHRWSFDRDGRALDTGVVYKALSRDSLRKTIETVNSHINMRNSKLPSAEMNAYVSQDLAVKIEKAQSDLDKALLDANTMLNATDDRNVNRTQENIDKVDSALLSADSVLDNLVVEYSRAKQAERIEATTVLNDAVEYLKNHENEDVSNVKADIVKTYTDAKMALQTVITNQTVFLEKYKTDDLFKTADLNNGSVAIRNSKEILVKSVETIQMEKKVVKKPIETKPVETKPLVKEDPVEKPTEPVKPTIPSKPVIITETEVVTERIPFTTKTIEDANLEVGQEQIDVEGVDGEKEITKIYDLEDGKRVGQPKIVEKTLKEPVEKVVRVGTKVVDKKVETEVPSVPSEEPKDKRDEPHGQKEISTEKRESETQPKAVEKFVQESQGKKKVVDDATVKDKKQSVEDSSKKILPKTSERSHRSRGVISALLVIFGFGGVASYRKLRKRDK